MMQNDAFNAGVEPGGLHSNHEIKILICHMLSEVPEPLTREDILSVICENGMANFFDTSAAIEELLASHHLEESKDRQLTATSTGRNAAITLRDSLPYTVRERSIAFAKKRLERRKNEESTDVVIRETENGFTVTCSIGDEGSSLLSLSLLVADESQAYLIREQFRSNPLLLYKSSVALLTGHHEIKQNQLLIDLK